MNVTAIKTKPVVLGSDLFKILDEAIAPISERSIVAITSKIVSICEGNVIKIGTVDKDTLVKKEADYYLPEKNKYNFYLSIKNNVMIPSAGIDESNGNGYYVLWPKDSQCSANQIRKYLIKKFKLKDVGVVIVDSKTTPLRWGVTGVAVAYSGFRALNDYVGKSDIFKRAFQVEKANIADAIASSAVVVMGEGNEQTPIAIIENVPFVTFQKNDPNQKELKEYAISIQDDLYAQILTGVRWLKGKSK